MSIHLIGSESINRICASQVIPSVNSCIRELVENALDAGSSSVSVRIRGKCEEIEVADNGCGIPEEDWNQMCQAHSTSKLEQYEDIVSEKLGSYGFRGEALSAICRLSQMTRIATRTTAMEAGRLLIYDNCGNLKESNVRLSKSIGTTVTVYGLFKDSLPVRYTEVLNSLKRELKIVQQLIIELAITNYNVKFEVLVDGKNVLSSSGGSDPYAVYKQVVSGDDLVRIENSVMSPRLQIHGWISSPNALATKTSATKGLATQFFYVNKKPVLPPKWVVKSISADFKASFIIFIDSVGDHGVDRNASVDKRTVIFNGDTQERMASAIREAVHDLTKSNRVRDMSGTRVEFRCSHLKRSVIADDPGAMETTEVQPGSKRVILDEAAPSSSNQRSEKFLYSANAMSATNSVEPTIFPRLVKRSYVNEAVRTRIPENKDESIIEDNTCLDDSLTSRNDTITPAPRTPKIENIPEQIPVAFRKEMFSKMEIVGQFNNGFIITKIEMGCPQLFLIDQHAANEKFLFEQYYNEIKVHSQALLSPRRLKVSPCQEETILHYRNRLDLSGFKLSFEPSELPGSRVSVHSLPTLTGIGFNRSAALTTNDLIEIISKLNDDESSANAVNDHLLSLVGSVRSMFASKACRTAVMVGDILNPTQMTEIVSSLSLLESPWTCPHGRPTLKHLLSYGDLDHLV